MPQTWNCIESQSTCQANCAQNSKQGHSWDIRNFTGNCHGHKQTGHMLPNCPHTSDKGKRKMCNDLRASKQSQPGPRTPDGPDSPSRPLQLSAVVPPICPIMAIQIKLQNFLKKTGNLRANLDSNGFHNSKTSVKTKSIQSIKEVHSAENSFRGRGAHCPRPHCVNCNSPRNSETAVHKLCHKTPTPGSKFNILDALHQPRRCLLP